MTSAKGVCKLVLPTGRLLACDPGWVEFGDVKPFTGTAPAGSFPIVLSLAEFGEYGATVACARIEFVPGVPAKWVLALQDGQDPMALRGGEAFGYSVDTGIGCFVDAAGVGVLSKEATYDELLKEMDGGGRDGMWGAFTLADGPSNVVAFSSGEGDGGYSSYWGLDDKGRPMCLLTDFAVFRTNIYATVSVENPRIGHIIEDPALKGRALTVCLSEDDYDGILLMIEGPGAGVVEGRFLDMAGKEVSSTKYASSGGYEIDGKNVIGRAFEPRVENMESRSLEIRFVARVESK